jgi:hypothetical protein
VLTLARSHLGRGGARLARSNSTGLQAYGACPPLHAYALAAPASRIAREARSEGGATRRAPLSGEGISIEKTPSASGFLMLCKTPVGSRTQQGPASPLSVDPKGHEAAASRKYNYFYILAPAMTPLTQTPPGGHDAGGVECPRYGPLTNLPVGGKFYNAQNIPVATAHSAVGRGAATNTASRASGRRGQLGRAAGVVCTLVRLPGWRGGAGRIAHVTREAGGATAPVEGPRRLQAPVGGRGCLIRLPSKKTKIVSETCNAFYARPTITSSHDAAAREAGGSLQAGAQGVSNPKHFNAILGKAGAAR